MVGDRIAWRRKENGRGTARVESNNWLWLKEVRLRNPMWQLWQVHSSIEVFWVFGLFLSHGHSDYPTIL